MPSTRPMRAAVSAFLESRRLHMETLVCTVFALPIDLARRESSHERRMQDYWWWRLGRSCGPGTVDTIPRSGRIDTTRRHIDFVTLDARLCVSPRTSRA